MKIPKLIHQIGPDTDSPRAKTYKLLRETWKRDYPDWKYIYWDDAMIESFIIQNYPHLLGIYLRFPFNVQRWDAARYLILYRLGGMYVDCDYESIEPMNPIIENCECGFSLEPDSHIRSHRHVHAQVFNNAMILAIPGHSFFKKIIDSVFSEESLAHNVREKDVCVFETTGPWKLVDLYDQLSPSEQKAISLLPAKYVTPFDIPQAIRFVKGEWNDKLEQCLEVAYAVHYFFGAWRIGNT
jgi:mannosyltransferase OCH1-like enzyme